MKKRIILLCLLSLYPFLLGDVFQSKLFAQSENQVEEEKNILNEIENNKKTNVQTVPRGGNQDNANNIIKAYIPIALPLNYFLGGYIPFSLGIGYERALLRNSNLDKKVSDKSTQSNSNYLRDKFAITIKGEVTFLETFNMTVGEIIPKLYLSKRRNVLAGEYIMMPLSMGFFSGTINNVQFEGITGSISTGLGYQWIIPSGLTIEVHGTLFGVAVTSYATSISDISTMDFSFVNPLILGRTTVIPSTLNRFGVAFGYAF